MSYLEKLTSPKWQKKRLQIFERDNWCCTQCGSEERTLHIHHNKYFQGRDPWEYEDHLLITLCMLCHEKKHKEIVDPERRYEHLIIRQQEPEVINTMNIQLHQLQEKLKENISDELINEILGNIVFLQGKIRELMRNSK